MPNEQASMKDAFRYMGEDIAEELSISTRSGEIPEEELEQDAYSSLNPAASLADHMEAIFGLPPARHHKIMIEALEDESIRRLAFVCPPGHAKTTVAGIGYASRKLALHPERHFIYFGNTYTQATKQSQAVRDLMDSERFKRFYPDVKRSPKGWAASKWYLQRPDVWDKDASMLSIGIDGGLLGSRGDEIIFDDVCSPDNMSTPEQRAKVRSKVLNVAFSRQGGISRNTRMISVMTRWHEDDLLSLFEEQGFTIIWMPALGYWEYIQPLGPLHLEEVNQLGETLKLLENGEPLWPEEYPRETYQPIKDSDPESFLLQYQGLVAHAAGNQFTDEDFRYWSNNAELGLKTLDPAAVRAVYIFWDTASKDKAENDFSAAQIWAWATDGYYLLAAWQDKLQFPNLVEAASALARTPIAVGNQGFQIRHTYVEETGTNNGAALVDTLLMRRIPATGLPPGQSKEARAGGAILVLRDSSRPVYFPWDAEAYRGVAEAVASRQLVRNTREFFIQQHKNFPRGRHDDFVDTTSQALEYLRNLPVKRSAEDAGKLRMPNAQPGARISKPRMLSSVPGGKQRSFQNGARGDSSFTKSKRRGSGKEWWEVDMDDLAAEG